MLCGFGVAAGCSAVVSCWDGLQSLLSDWVVPLQPCPALGWGPCLGRGHCLCLVKQNRCQASKSGSQAGGAAELCDWARPSVVLGAQASWLGGAADCVLWLGGAAGLDFFPGGVHAGLPG